MRSGTLPFVLNSTPAFILYKDEDHECSAAPSLFFSRAVAAFMILIFTGAK
jgi:hypothetical protein